MMAEGTGYIQLRDFSETTDRELGAALRDLTKQGMKRLVLDIRENPGGPLDQAIKVSNRFLKKGDLIVYTRGRIPNSDQDYRGVESSEYTDLPLDRARKPPQRQRVGDCDGCDTGSRSRPRRRRDDLGQGARAVDLPAQRRRGARAHDGALLHACGPADSAAVGRELRRVSVLHDARSERAVQHAPADLKYTLRLGRKVYSGGGIEPDHRMPGPVEGFNPGKFARRLSSHDVRELRAAVRPRRGHALWRGDRHQSAPNARRREFTVDDAMLQDFKAFVKSQLRDPSQFDEAGFNADLEFIRAMIRYEIDIALVRRGDRAPSSPREGSRRRSTR